MDKERKKQLAAEYRQTFRPMGVYRIVNTANGKCLVDGSMNLDGARNRLEFCKQTNLNSIPELQQDWELYGGQCFVFEELDRIQPRDELAGDPSAQRKYKEEVDALLELWLEKLQPYGEKGYNKPKRTG
jgi:hypothetical protein